MNQTRMPLRILLVVLGMFGQPIVEQVAPRKAPGLSAPERKACTRNPVAVLVNSGSGRITTARLLYIGRMSPASIGPPESWPCRPSTPRLSRLPQPTSRRRATP